MMEPLFQFQMQHGYFSDGVYQGCALAPDGRTAGIIRRYGLITRMEHGVFTLYISQEGRNTGLIDYLNEQLRGEPLKFNLVSNASQFAFITELPFDWVGQVEMSSRNVIPDGAKLELQQTLAGRLVNRENVIGVFSLYLDDLQARQERIPRYCATFQARVIPWRYYVVNRSNIKLASPRVCNKNSECFDGPEPVALPNGEQGLCFSSGKRKYPVQQVPTELFDLVDRLPPAGNAAGGSMEQCLIHGLPTPGEGELWRGSGGGEIFGAMYVYL